MAKQHLCWTLAVAVVVCAVLVTLNLVSTSWAGGPDTRGLERALEVQNRNTDRLLSIKGVVGTATGLEADGHPVVQIYTEAPGVAGLPRSLEGVPVVVKVSGEIRALEATDRYDRPVPIGVSTGNEGEISAGTIACRVTDGTNVYALSNNHVYALENDAPIGSKILQPGLYDTDGVFDENNVIGTLHDFEPIKFSPSRRTRNKIDAAIAISDISKLGTTTPSDGDGYGAPDPTIVAAELGQVVMKYGRTTALTYGEITGINAIVNVGYGSGTARFVDQIIVESADVFIQGGDSGSLLVTDPGKNPVGLLFAGNGDGTLAVANRIDLVLARFDVTIDGEEPPPVTVTDIAVTDVVAPGSVLQGALVDVDVVVANVGNVDVTTDIGVTLTDDTDDATIAEKINGGLAAGASTTLTFSWDTTGASLGEHTLIASQDFADDDATNDSARTLVTVTEEVVGPTMHVDSIEMSTGSRRAGRNTFVWAVAVVTIVDASGVVPVEVEGATVNGHWEDATGDSDYGTTDVSGEVSLESNSVKNPAAGTTFTFVVDGVAKAGCTYDSGANVETSASITL